MKRRQTILNRIKLYEDRIKKLRMQLNEIDDRESRLELAQTKIEDMCLSSRAYEGLKKLGVRTAFDVYCKSNSELLVNDNFGRRSLKEVREVTNNILKMSGFIE